MSDPVAEGKIREILAHLIGKRVLDISQQDPEDIAAGKDSFVELMFEDGNTLKFFIADSDAYVGGFPMSFSDPNPRPEDDDGLWHPNAAERNGGAWAVVEMRTDKGPVNHVLPTSEPLHALDESCWCGPDCSDPGTVTHFLKE